MDENEVKDAIRTILRDNKNYEKSLNYAINYCCAALEQKMAGKNLKVQCLYILNNIQYWRGKGNKEVRATLKRFVK